MWAVFGIGAFITALLNLECWAKSKNSEVFRFTSVSLTALTVCALYSMNATWVAAEDWSALMDVIPTMSKALWVLVLASVLINAITLVKRKPLM